MTVAVGPLFLGRPSVQQRQEAVSSCFRLPFNFPHLCATQSAPPLPADVSPQRDGWAVDAHAMRVGSGRAAYNRAQALVRQWRHFDLGWAFTNAPEVKEGAGVVVTARSLGLWTCNPLRICYVEEGRFDRRRQQQQRGRDAAVAGETQQQQRRWPWQQQQQDQERKQGGGGASSSGGGTASKQHRQRAGAAGPPSRGRRFAFGHATLAGHQICGEERFAVSWAKDGDDSVWYEIFTISRPATPLAKLMQPLLRHYQARFARESMAAVAAQVAEAGEGRP